MKLIDKIINWIDSDKVFHAVMIYAIIIVVFQLIRSAL